MHQIGFDCEELDLLFKNGVDNKAIAEVQQPTEKNTSSEGGRKSILDSFSNIPDIATEFIKADGFKAQEKRRDTTITSCGVSVKDVKWHLCQAIPGLREFGISDSTVRYLFKPVKEGIFAAERYKSVIDASVPQKDNSKHKDNIDAHYMLSRIKMRRDLAAYVRDEWTVASTDLVNKIRYGTMAVSRYHQIRKIFLSDDAPKYPDNNFPLPYKTVPDGVMFLSDNKDDDSFIEGNLIENSLESNKNQLTELEIKAKKVQKQKDRLSKSLFRAAYELTVDAPSEFFGQITNELALKDFGTLIKEKLKEEVITFMTTENRFTLKK